MSLHADQGTLADTLPTGLLSQFLAWVSARPRTYADTMDAWRTSCPRLSVWENASADGLVRVDTTFAGPLREAAVLLTPRGAALLDARAAIPPVSTR